MIRGCEGPRDFAENGLKIDVSMRSNMYGFAQENQGFRMSTALEYSANSQKLNLKWTPVWKAKCKEFQKEHRGFRVSLGLEDSANSQKMA